MENRCLCALPQADDINKNGMYRYPAPQLCQIHTVLIGGKPDVHKLHAA